MKILFFLFASTFLWEINEVSANSNKPIDIIAINKTFVGKLYVSPGAVVPKHLYGLKVL